MTDQDYNHFNAARLNDRNIDELIGLCRGMMADGVVNQQEAEFLRGWIERNRDLRETWPASVIYARITGFMKDGHLDADEAKELMQTLVELTGNTLAESDEILSTALPLCDPAPDVHFQNRKFCMTGKFVTGTREKVEGIIANLGGRAVSTPSFDTRYLVIGEVGSRDWIHSTHGRKIEKAIELQQRGIEISIISEQHWASFLIEN